MSREPPPGVYIAHADRDLSLWSITSEPVSALDLRATLTLYVLLYRSLTILDGPSVYSDPLADLFVGKVGAGWGGDGLLDAGVLRFAHRDVAPKFVDLETYLRETNTWNTGRRSDVLPLLQHLDAHSPAAPVIYSNDDAYNRFSDLARRALADPVLMRRLGLTGHAAFLTRYLGRRAGSFGGRIRRSFFYDYADGLSSANRRDASVIREFASGLYHSSHASLLELAPAYPRQYRDATFAIYGPGASAGGSGDGAAEIIWKTVSFPVGALALLTGGDISAIRGSDEFETYVRATVAARGRPHEASVETQAYLGFLAEALTSAVGGTAARQRGLQRAARLVQTVTLAGDIVLALAIGDLVTGLGAAMTWTLMGIGAEHQISTEIESQRQKALVRLPDRVAALNRGGVRGTRGSGED